MTLQRLARLSMRPATAVLALSCSVCLFAQSSFRPNAPIPSGDSFAATQPASASPASGVLPEIAELQRPGSSTATLTPAPSNSPRNWTTDQILTATVHQAWILSGKDENNFFEIVRELAEISAQNRNLTLPDNPAAGKKAGAYIRAQAKADHDQLLYDIVDKAVRMTGAKSAGAQVSSAPHPPSGK